MTEMTVNLYFKWFQEYSMKARERELKLSQENEASTFFRQWLKGLEFSLVYSRHSESTHTHTHTHTCTQMGNLKYKHLLCEHKHTWVCWVKKKEQRYIFPLAMSRCKTLMGQSPKLMKSQKACNTTFSCFTLEICHSSLVMLQSRG